jgi:hypothetical protein
MCGKSYRGRTKRDKGEQRDKGEVSLRQPGGIVCVSEGIILQRHFLRARQNVHPASKPSSFSLMEHLSENST